MLLPSRYLDTEPTNGSQYCCSSSPFRLPQSATPTALRQGKKQPLTVLVSVAFAHQRNGSDGSKSSAGVCLLDTFFLFFHGHF